MQDSMVTLGVTGTMGAGKTTICNMFSELGVEVIDADKVSHQLMEPFRPLWWTLTEYFGQGIIDRDTSTIDRIKLGFIVFNDCFLLQKLNLLMHPLIMKQIKYQLRQLQENEVRMVVLDAPLLIEVGLQSAVDKVLVVLIEKKNRLARLKNRNPQLTDREIIQRSCSQMSQEEKQKYADYVIDNNGKLKKTRQQVDVVFHDLVDRIKVHG